MFGSTMPPPQPKVCPTNRVRGAAGFTVDHAF